MGPPQHCLCFWVGKSNHGAEGLSLKFAQRPVVLDKPQYSSLPETVCVEIS